MAAKIKVVGARVRVEKSSHPGAKEFIGQEGVVLSITPSLGFLVGFNCGASWFYKEGNLVLV